MPKAKAIRPAGSIPSIQEQPVFPSQKKVSKRQTLEEIYGSEIERPRVLARSAVGFKALLLLTVVALIGGFLAGLVQDNLFESYYQGWGAVNLEPKAEGPKLLDLNFLLKDQDNQYDQVLSEIRSHLVGFYAV